MTKREAYKIIVINKAQAGLIDETIVSVTPADILFNISYNDYQGINLDFIQDFTVESGPDHEPGDMFQGHSLAAIDLFN